MPALHRLEFPVDFPPGHVAAYVVTGPEPILIDAGPMGEAGESVLREALMGIGLEIADIEHLLFTHFHTDHVGQTEFIRSAAAPTIHLPATFRQRLALSEEEVRRRAQESLQRTGLDPTEVDAALVNIAPPHGRMRTQLPPSAVDHWFEPGSAIDVGGRTFQPLHTPGHDETHVSYLLESEDKSVLVAGDMALRPFRTWIVRTGWINGLETAVADFEAALDRLATVDADTVYPGHGPVHAELKPTIDRDRAGLQRRLDHCAAAVPDAGSTAADIARSLGRDAPTVERLLPEVVAALDALERTGRVAIDSSDGVRRYHATTAGST
ncbi:MAG: MBL fold metallo-hydrolase [Salinirussus sp.]